MLIISLTCMSRLIRRVSGSAITNLRLIIILIAGHQVFQTVLLLPEPFWVFAPFLLRLLLLSSACLSLVRRCSLLA